MLQCHMLQEKLNIESLHIMHLFLSGSPEALLAELELSGKLLETITIYSAITFSLSHSCYPSKLNR